MSCARDRALVRITNRDALFQEVCKALVEQADFRMAWLGWYHAATHQLLTVASFGNHGTELGGRAVYADDRPEGRGPSGRAFRAGQSVVSNDLLADPRLEEVAIDIALALEAVARDAERVRATENAQREQALSSAILESMRGMVYRYDEQRRFLGWNDNLLRVSGYTADELATMHPLDFFAGADRDRVAERIAQVFHDGEALVEASFLLKDGRSIPYLFTRRRLAFDGHNALVGMGIDVSERRRAEMALQQSDARFHSTLDSMAEGCRLINFGPEDCERHVRQDDSGHHDGRRCRAERAGRFDPAASGAAQPLRKRA